MRHVLLLGVMLSASLGWAGSKEWLGPPPPGRGYPAGEADRQFAMLVHDLAHREAFQKVAGQTFRREALIRPSDRDPLDVLLRRTEALLTDVPWMRTGWP